MRNAVVCAIVALFVFPLVVSASTKDDEVRREHIHELMKAMKVEQTMRAGFHAILEQMRQQMLSRYHVAEDEADRDAIESAAASTKELNEYLDRYEEIVFQKIDMKAVEDQVYIPLYEKYFSDDEVQQLVAFYNSPAGKKSIDVLPGITQEAVLKSTELLQPVMVDTMAQLGKEQEKKFPWRRTMSDMRSIAVAMEAYAVDTEQYPADTDYDHLKETLTPVYLKEIPEKDGWGNAYEIVVSPDHQHYRIISAGADGVIEWDSRKITIADDGTNPETKVTDSIDDDIIFADGTFVQRPKVSDREAVDFP